jgi:hypothetical protein
MRGYVAGDPIVRDLVLQRNLAKSLQSVKTPEVMNDGVNLNR